MGWSIDNKILQIERIFRKQKRRVKVSRPEHPYPLVYISYDGKRLSPQVMDEVVQLFPDHVCVHFIPEYIFPVENLVNQTEGSNTATVKLDSSTVKLGAPSEPARSITTSP